MGLFTLNLNLNLKFDRVTQEKQGKWQKKILCQGKHREFGNFAKIQGKHREFIDFRKQGYCDICHKISPYFRTCPPSHFCIKKNKHPQITEIGSGKICFKTGGKKGKYRKFENIRVGTLACPHTAPDVHTSRPLCP